MTDTTIEPPAEIEPSAGRGPALPAPTAQVLAILDSVSSATRTNLRTFRAWLENLEAILNADEVSVRGRLAALVHVNQQLSARLSALSHEFADIHSSYQSAKKEASHED